MSIDMDWDDPETIDWDEREESLSEYDTRQCFPFGCYPRQFCFPRHCFPQFCNPRGFCNPRVSCMPLCFPRR